MLQLLLCIALQSAVQISHHTLLNGSDLHRLLAVIQCRERLSRAETFASRAETFAYSAGWLHQTNFLLTRPYHNAWKSSRHNSSHLWTSKSRASSCIVLLHAEAAK